MYWLDNGITAILLTPFYALYTPTMSVETPMLCITNITYGY